MVHIHRVAAPDSLEDPSAWTLNEMARLDLEASIEMAGHADFATSPQEFLVSLRHQVDAAKMHLLALAHPDSHEALGWVGIDMPLKENTKDAWILIVTDARHRRQGVAQALHDAAVETLRADGRTQAMGYTYFSTEPPSGPGALESPTGFGRIPADAAATLFALKNGYRLAQVERASTLHLPADPVRLAQLRAQAAQAAEPTYRTVSWVGACPEAHIDHLARLNEAMSRDIPQGEFNFDEEHWDADRIRASEKRRAESGVLSLICAAQLVQTGELVAYTELTVPASRPQACFQQNTIVLGAHRGHRLGLLVKADNLTQLAQRAPQVERIHTWNAEENNHMLAINIALGYAPSGVEGQWKADI